MALRAVLLAHSSLNAFCSEIHFGLPITFSVLQYLVGSAQLCLLRRCHSVYVSCQCFTDSVVSTPLSNFVPICWHLDIHVRVERMGIRRQFCFTKEEVGKPPERVTNTRKRFCATPMRRKTELTNKKAPGWLRETKLPTDTHPPSSDWNMSGTTHRGVN